MLVVAMAWRFLRIYESRRTMDEQGCSNGPTARFLIRGASGLFDDLLADFAISEEEDGDDHQQDDEKRDIDESVTDV